MHKSLLRQLLIMACLLPVLAQAEVVEKTVFEKTLGNGLKVIVKEDHRAPVLVQQIWYRAGSMDESSGTTGIAHVLEHMMFKAPRPYRRESSPSALPPQAGARMRLPAMTTPPIFSSCIKTSWNWR